MNKCLDLGLKKEGVSGGGAVYESIKRVQNNLSETDHLKNADPYTDPDHTFHYVQIRILLYFTSTFL